MNKKVLSVVVALGLITTMSSAVFADPLSDQLQQQQQQLQQSKGSLQGVQVQEQNLEAKIETLDEQIMGIMQQMNNNNKEIANAKDGIKSAEADTVKAENDLKTEQSLFDQRMRALYINGVDGYVEIILGSKNFNDFLSRVETVKSLVKFDEKVVNDLNAKKVQLNEKKEALSVQENKLLALNADSQKKLDSMNADKAEQTTLITALKEQDSLYSGKVNSDQALVNETLRQIDEIRSGVPKYTPSRGAASYSDNAVIAYASNFLGTPYVWGGTTPRPGFDCSGFVRYVFAHFGIYLDRTTYGQINDGVPVPKDQIQPGDLVFFGSPSAPYHVGIYVGNGTYIHAPHTGDVVRISSLGRNDFSAARRVR